MQPSIPLPPDMSTPVWTASSGSILTMIEDAVKRLMALLREAYSAIDMPALKDFSRMVMEALRHSQSREWNEQLVLIVLVVSLILGVIALMGVWRMLWTGMRIETAAFKPIDKQAVTSARSLRAAIGHYFRSLANNLLGGLMLFLGVLVLTTVFFLFCKILWFSYLASPLGRFYSVYFPHQARLIGMLLGQDMFIFPFVLTTIAFGSGMICAAVCRLVYLTRFFYLSRGLVGKIVLLALPLNVAAAAVARSILPHPHWGAAYAATLIPTLLSFTFCFRFTNRFLPELGMFFHGPKREDDAPLNIIFLNDLNSGKRVLEFDPLSGKRSGKRFPSLDGVHTQGQFLARRGHDLILYRYGHDLYFRVDDLELKLDLGMSVQRLQRGRFLRRFELSAGDTRLFRLRWSMSPLSGAPGPTAAFLDTLEEILQNREAYEEAFIIIADDPEPADPGIPA